MVCRSGHCGARPQRECFGQGALIGAPHLDQALALGREADVANKPLVMIVSAKMSRRISQW